MLESWPLDRPGAMLEAMGTPSSRRATGWAAVLIIAVAAASSSPAAASEPASALPPEPPAAGAPDEWYGYQTLAVDGAALAVAVLSLAENDRSLQGGLLAGAGLAYVAGAPIVHGLQDEANGALVSLGLRVGSPLLGALAGYGLSSFAPYDDGDERVIGVALGFLVGLVPPIVIDPALLAWKTPGPTDARASPGSAWRPRLVLSGERVGLLVSKRF